METNTLTHILAYETPASNSPEQKRRVFAQRGRPTFGAARGDIRGSDAREEGRSPVCTPRSSPASITPDNVTRPRRTMTKYKLNNAARSSSEVTLTSYLAADKGCQISVLDNDNLESESNRNLGHACVGCELPGAVAALEKSECGKYGLNELKVDGLDPDVCLCAKFNGGCKLRPRPSLAPTLNLSLDGKVSCLACHGGSCGSPYPSE